jgi:cell division inhibitor SepF
MVSLAPPEPPQQAPRIKTLAPNEEPSKDAVVGREPRRAERLHVVAPEGFNDAKEIGDQLRGGVPVIMNLVDVDKDLRRRLVDFASGLAYGVHGKMERVADSVFLITPTNVEVSAEERRRMRERGLFSSGV